MGLLCEGKDKQRYIEFCERDKDVPIFHTPWWMDAMCGPENWDVFLIGEGKDIKAYLVYQLDENKGVKSIHRTLLTQNSGLGIRYQSNQGVVTRQKFEEKIINEICDYIESLGLSRYDQQYNYAIQNYLPFFWRRYAGQVKYTYVIEDTSDLDVVRSEYASKLRNQIKKAEKYLRVEEIDDLEEFYRVNKLTFDRQEIQIPYTYEQFVTLTKACQERECCKLLAARNDENHTQSVAMLVWDDKSVYYLLNGTDPEYKQFQGNLLLIDKSIEIAHDLGKKFDFEGSVIKTVNHCFREFAGIPMPYFRITKEF